jgi:hypothetical protein
MKMEEQTQAEETVITTGNPEAGSEEEALQLLAKAKEADTKPEGEADDVVEGEEAEADPDLNEEDAEAKADEESESEPEVAEVEIDGETYQVPSKLKDGYLRQAEFSRNMNEVGEQRKVAELTIKEATQMRDAAESYAIQLAKVYECESRVKSFNGVDWQTVRTNNPAEYAALAADLRTAELELERQIDNTKLVAQQVNESGQKVLETKRDEMFKTLAKSLPKWGDELGTKITNYALNNGFTVEELQVATNPKYVEAIYKSMRYDELQKTKDGIKDKIRSVSPVLKPSNKPNNAKKDAYEQFNKNRNSTDAALAALSAARGR